MKNIIAVSCLLISINVNAGNSVGIIQYNASTGDSTLDVQLKDMNIKASANINDFISTLGFKYEVSTSKIKHLIVDYNFTPADAYMTLSISRITDKSIHDVAHTYKDNKLKGWGFVAKEMGIKPGSREFHQLKKAMKYDESEVTESASGKGKNKKWNKGQGKGKGKNK